MPRSSTPADTEARIAALEQALREAIDHCRWHNSDYHHRTEEQDLQAWEALLTRKPPTRRRSASSSRG